MINLLGVKTWFTNMIEVKFFRNTRFLDITNNSSEPRIVSNDEALGCSGSESYQIL